MWGSGWSDPGSRGSLTYVDVSWETCAAAEPEQQREQGRGQRAALRPHGSSCSPGGAAVIPFTADRRDAPQPASTLTSTGSAPLCVCVSRSPSLFSNIHTRSAEPCCRWDCTSLTPSTLSPSVSFCCAHQSSVVTPKSVRDITVKHIWPHDKKSSAGQISVSEGSPASPAGHWDSHVC